MARKTPKKRGTTRQPVKRPEYPCPVCIDRTFKTEQGFNDHVKFVHNIFSCPKCDELFAAEDDLIRHRNGARHGKPAFGGKVKSAFSASVSETEYTSSMQMPMRVHQQSSQARPSIGQNREPPTDARFDAPAKARGQSPAQGHQQSADQVRQTHGQVVQPQTHVLSPQPHISRSQANIVESQPYLHPSGYQVFRHQFPAQGHQQSADQVHQTHGQVAHSPAQVLSPQTHVFRSQVNVDESQPYLDPSEYQVFPVPTPVSDRQTQLSQIQAEIRSEIEHAAAHAHRTQARMSPPPVQVFQTPSEVYERRPRVYHAPAQGYRGFAQGSQPQLHSHYSSTQGPQSFERASVSSGRSSQASGRASQSLRHNTQAPPQYPHLPAHHSRPPVQNSESREEDSHFHMQHSQIQIQIQNLQSPLSTTPLQHSQSQMHHSQNEMQVRQPPAQTSSTPLQDPAQAEQLPSPPTHLSAKHTTTAEANDTVTPAATATNTTSSSMQPEPSTQSLSLIYDGSRHRWTNLDPLEQTLLHKYVLGRCHPVQRLRHQGYHIPQNTDTTTCLNKGEPHQTHNFACGSMRLKAIVINCETINTTKSTAELAFIVAIDFLTGEVLINSYVAPTATVTNWMTPVSGITQEKMDAAVFEGKAFRSNRDARNALNGFLDRDTVLIGHALHHDLRTLGLSHGRIVDTALVTAEAVFPNFSSKSVLPRIWQLGQLAREMLDLQIQKRGEGRSSLENALAIREVLIWCLRSPECLRAWAEKTRSQNEHIRQQRKRDAANAAK
ncbi:Exonuclease RNase T/DNA polymerase III [Penicillium concentricum]|uniref:Exonuclease RNase T/DNA polymerase III n=1 Tax=Penicillium concentricum TaxID=293559 RepID=A0A9W9S5Y7_9EURO|nr:Exonuclease RNase T/DNA polymerase III [Penicillium concentricum]KAJ5372696.1 Exonuclease RNase T/DNA polymerase III [Penicillium concentricum]